MLEWNNQLLGFIVLSSQDEVAGFTKVRRGDCRIFTKRPLVIGMPVQIIFTITIPVEQYTIELDCETPLYHALKVQQPVIPVIWF